MEGGGAEGGEEAGDADEADGEPGAEASAEDEGAKVHGKGLWV